MMGGVVMWDDDGIITWDDGAGMGGCGGTPLMEQSPGDMTCWAARAPALARLGSKSTCHRFFNEELKWFLTALSDRPGSVLAICAHLGPICKNICVGEAWLGVCVQTGMWTVHIIIPLTHL